MANNEKSGWGKWIIGLLLVGGAVAGGMWFYKSRGEEPPEFLTTKVTRGDLTQAVTATGTLNPVLNVQVGSQVSGIISKLYADFNSRVKAGELVAQLDPATYQTRVQQNEADLASARAQLELAQVNARRAEELFKDKLIAQSDYDQTVATLHQAEASVLIKQAALNSSKVDLTRCSIYSPIEGIVIDRKVDVGQTVAASMNAPVLFQIANDLTKMQIDANVSEADVGTVEENQSVNFTVDAFPGRTFVGKVIQIRNVPTTVQNVVTYNAVVEVSNPDLKLKPGMTANVSIVTAERKGVLKIPNGALRFKPPEPSTNKTFAARLLAKIGLGGETKPAATNSVTVAKAGDTNKTEVVASAEPPLTGNEPPDVLFRRMREMRDRGEEPSPEVRAKLRELFQSGAIQRPGGGGGGGEGGGRGNRGGGGINASARPAAPAVRTVYLLGTNTPAGGSEPVAAPQPVRVKTGISDGAYTEISDGVKEGDSIITSVKLTTAQTAAAPTGNSPFGGGGGFGRGGGR